jgi:hypothetical protein
MKIDDAIKEFRVTTGDPLWKTFLNWGAVVTFLSLPLIMLCVQMYGRTHPGWMDTSSPEHFKYLGEFQRNLTILVFGLAGLRTWENVKNGKPKNEST